LRIWKGDVGDQDVANFSSASSTKLLRRVSSWVWLITSGAIPVVMLAMKLTFCWMVYNRKGDSQALAIAAAVIAPGRSAFSRRHRSHRTEGSQPTSIPGDHLAPSRTNGSPESVAWTDSTYGGDKRCCHSFMKLIRENTPSHLGCAQVPAGWDH
jgi:hypothetical protein